MNLSKKSKIIIIICASLMIILGGTIWILKYLNRNYEVTFKNEYLSQEYKEKVQVNTKVVEPAEPQKEGYSFTGWWVDDQKFDFSTPITKDITLTAKYVIDPTYVYKQQVRFDSNGGSSIETQSVIRGQNVVEPSNPTKNSYEFVRWNYNGVEFDWTMPVEEDITLVAEWTISLSEDEKNLIQAKNELGPFDIYKANPTLKTSAVNGKCQIVWRDADFDLVTREKEDVTKKVTADITCGTKSITKSVIATIKASTYRYVISQLKSSYKMVIYDGSNEITNYKLLNTKLYSVAEWKQNRDGNYANISSSNWTKGQTYYIIFKDEKNTTYYVETK